MNILDKMIFIADNERETVYWNDKMLKITVKLFLHSSSIVINRGAKNNIK